MKIHSEIRFEVLSEDSTTILLETKTGKIFVAAICSTPKEAHLICYLLNQVVKGKVFPGPIATEAERGGQE